MTEGSVPRDEDRTAGHRLCSDHHVERRQGNAVAFAGGSELSVSSRGGAVPVENIDAEQEFPDPLAQGGWMAAPYPSACVVPVPQLVDQHAPVLRVIDSDRH